MTQEGFEHTSISNGKEDELLKSQQIILYLSQLKGGSPILFPVYDWPLFTNPLLLLV